jgi:hypothetical protein
LHAMGWETANVHLGSRNVKTIRRHLAQCHAGWLRAAADAMVKQTMRDWKEWKGAPVKPSENLTHG